MTNALKRMAELLPRIEPVKECCRTCADNIKATGYCDRFKADIPAEALDMKGCDKWSYDEIPF
jgi:hypothetical protein